MDRHDTLLIASASPDNRKILRNILSGRYNLLEAGSARQAMVLLRQEAREKMLEFFHREVREFADANLRRVTRSFEMDTQGESLEITLLRTNTVHTQRRTAAILCRRVASRPQSQEQPGMLSDSTFVCRNDSDFTLIRLGRQVPLLAGYTPEELESRFRNQLMQLILPEERETVRRTLTYFAEMLSVFLLKRRQQEKAVTRADALHTILDNQNAWIYIIDPDTCQLKYLNAKTRELAPEVQEGMTCYGSLMGMPERCAGCPSRNIRREKNASALLHNPRFDLHVLAEATLIQWEQEESCLMTCRQLPKKDT